VYVDFVRAITHHLLCVGMGNQGFVVRGAERSEVVTFLTGHDAGMILCRREECKQIANLVIEGMVLAFDGCKS